MGKPTGFLEYERATNPARPEDARVRDFKEFHEMLPQDQRRAQAARCMNCGVPFCQSNYGCPLGNLIPEWNDMVYLDNLPRALSRLLKTSPFPEFTGRVCPALCEAACSLNREGDAVTVRENELYIIEEAFAQGLIAPRVPAHRSGRRVAVVGSGPSGLATADLLNRRGHLVTVYERADRPGGLLTYGIPGMKLDKNVVKRRIRLMEAEGVVFQTGASANTSLLNKFDAVVLCCGARKPRDLAVPGREAKGALFAVDFLTMATQALLDSSEPEISAKGRRVVIVGGGDTGNDCAGTCLRQGCVGLTQLEMMPKPPVTRQNNWPAWPRVLKTDYGQEEAIARFGSDPRIYQTTVQSLEKDDSGALKAVHTIKLKPDANGRMTPVPGTEDVIPAELLLIAAGFVGCEAETAQAFGAARTPRGNLETLPGTHQTAIAGLFTAGDMRTGQSLVVRAIADGREAAREVDKYLMGYTNL